MSSDKKKVENQKKEYQPWIENYRNKQSDQLNAMIGVGVGFIFGYFQVLEKGYIISVGSFLLLICTIFSYFYSRYWHYLIAEAAILHQLNIKPDDKFKNLEKDKSLESHDAKRPWADNRRWMKKAKESFAIEGEYYLRKLWWLRCPKSRKKVVVLCIFFLLIITFDYLCFKVILI